MSSKMKLLILFISFLSFTLASSGGMTSRGRCSPGCPSRHCLQDSAVIHGYCCGCARVTDHLPINCPGLHVKCPVDGRWLCKSYDYMLDCCCP